MDSDIPSVALLYEGFGHFLDIMDGHYNVSGLVDIDDVKLQTEVDKLTNKMYESYKNEVGWREAALSYLNHIFLAPKSIWVPLLHTDAIGSLRSDDHNIVTHGAEMMVVVFEKLHATS